MYFKRIEMHGFKSFAEPVIIDFHEGITCIIGPNGSGKSNISDAIRWVLGEQSPKMLRGGKMEEVIFAGTASRKSRGMAEVTLVIDNETGMLSIPYNEVAITRRMYRSGESEYAINKNQCRLRDIRELIMDTGIGVDGYSLIGQGKISDIVSNKTESRREIFEEAAGIVMYRTKKAESERKLQSTSANLERINDIIGEIESRIDGLQEDSKKAKEYIGLRDQYKVLEINITLKNIESLELKNEYIKDDIMEMQDKLQDIEDHKTKMEHSLAENKKKSEELEQAITCSRETLLDHVNEINRLVNRGQLSKERLIFIEENLKQLNIEIADLEEKLQKEQRSEAELLQTKKQLHRELEQMNNQLQEKIDRQKDLVERNARIVEAAEEQKNEIFALSSEINRKVSEVTSLKNLQDTLSQRKQKVLEEKGWGEGHNREALDLLNKRKTERNDLEQQIEEVTKRGTLLREQHRSKTAQEQTLTRKVADLSMKLGQLSSRKKTIEEMEHNYEGYNYAVKFIMKAAPAGVWGVVAELISVPSGYETAIETALGAALQNIVCENDQSAQNAISLLKQNKAGRLTFLPLSSIRGGRGSFSNDVARAEGFCGFGTECIDFDQRYKPVIDYLLGRVVIMDNMDHAVEISKKAGGFRYVTLEGEIVNASGAITGGKYRNKTADLLERKAEITKLSEELERIRSKKGACNEVLADLRNVIASEETQLKHTEEEYRALEMTLLSKNNDIQVTESGLSDYKENSSKWNGELGTIDAEQRRSQKMINTLMEEKCKGQQAIAELEAAIEESQKESQWRKAEIEALAEEITADRVKAAASESKKSNTDALAARIQNTIEELKKQKQDKETRRKELLEEKSVLGFDHTDIETIVKQKEEQKANLESYIEEVTEERAAAATAVNRITQEKEAAEEQITAFRNQKYELEIKQAKNETQLDAYKDRLWEDFEVSYIQAVEFKKNHFVMAEAVKENRQIKARMKALGEINIGAIAEYEKVSERYHFLTNQRADILDAMESLNHIIEDMDKTIKIKFKESFDQVVINFEKVFSELFGGGHAELRLEDETNPLESGIDIIAQPPGKKLQNINLLSGGEKTMTAMALMFAVLTTKPTPFCILDEVEAALDDANIERFAAYLKKFTEIQFTLVTHQKATMEHADVLYGVTMPEQGVSKVLSLDLNDDFHI